MLKRWAGPCITALIFVGVALILVLNLDLGKTGKAKTNPQPPPIPPGNTEDNPKPVAIPGEHPIGEPVERNHIVVAAVWLRAVADGRHGCRRGGPGPSRGRREGDRG